jgi:HEAT repeat protein
VQVSQGHIFLSYRTLERPFAAKIAADLKNCGFALWMDRFDIQPGEQWDRAIASAIDGCAGLVAVLSPAYVNSEVCLDELARAHSAGRAIFPIVLQPLASPSDWPLLIQRHQFVDFFEWKIPTTYRARLGELVKALQQQFNAQAGQSLDPEAQYLNKLLAELEITRGVLEYVPLNVVADEGETANERKEDEWAFDVLLDVEPGLPGETVTRLYEVDTLLRDHRQLVLLGDAGTGKTTTLRWVARRAALARKRNPRGEPLPVLLSLGQWLDTQTFDEFVIAGCSSLVGVDLSVASGDVLLLLDGLNEMGSRGHDRSQALRSWLEGSASKPRAVITCRRNEYAKLELGGMPTAALRELDEQQVKQFATRYLEARASDFLQLILPEPTASSDARLAMRDLARNPYMLSAFIYLYQDRPEEGLPSNTGALFSRLAKALWIREERRKSRGGQATSLGWEPVKATLAQLARAMIESGEADDARAPFTLEKLGGEEVFLAALDAGLLILNGDFTRFAHDLLRSYFAAEAFASASAEVFDGWCRAHVSHWQPVAVAWSGISSNAEAYLKQSNWQDSAELVQRGYAASGDVIRYCARRAMEELAVDNWRSFQPAMEALTQFGRAVVPLLVGALQSDDAELREKAAFVLGRIRDPVSVEPLIARLTDQSEGVRSRSLESLLNIGGEKAHGELAKHVKDGSAPRRRGAAIAIGKLAPPDAMKTLLGLLADPEEGVRRAAVESLGRLGDPRALDAIATLTSSPDDDLRASVMESLGRLGAAGAHVYLVEGLCDPVKKVKIASISGLKQLCRAESIPPLLGALRDESDEVREQAAIALREIGVDLPPEPLLSALKDDSAKVRIAAARALDRAAGMDVQQRALEALRASDPAVWEAAADVLDRRGWTALDASDRIRWYAAKGRWDACLALGDEAIPELRRVIELGDEPRQRAAVGVLRKIGWKPTQPGAELFRYHIARVDWKRQDRLNPVQLLNLLAWTRSPAPERSPASKVAAEMVAETFGTLCGAELDRAIAEGTHQTRFLATIAAGASRCTQSVPMILRNLNAPRDEAPAFVQGALRIVSAQSLSEIGETGAPVLDLLLDHAMRGIASSIPIFENASAIAAIQSAASFIPGSELFRHIPASALGQDVPEESPAAAMFGDSLASKVGFAVQMRPVLAYNVGLWAHFGMTPDKPEIKASSVADVVDVIASFDRATLPPFSPFYSELAYWELHSRLATISLIVLAWRGEEATRHLALAALAKIPSSSAAPVLEQVPLWARAPLSDVAAAELERRTRES